jgi:hypothetical protein
MKKISMTLLLTMLIICANFSLANAAFEWTEPAWNIPFAGTMKAPMGFSAVEVKDFGSFIEQEKNKLTDPNRAKAASTNNPLLSVPSETPALLKDALPVNGDSAKNRFLKSIFALYHLTLDDGESVHMAWFLAARDGETLPPAIDVFTKALTPEQIEQLETLNKWINANIHKARYTDAKNKVDLKLLQLLPLEDLARQDGKLWTTGARVMITVERMPFAFFSRIYALNIDNHLVVGILGGFDGERSFWEPVIREMLLGMQPNPAVQ